MSKFNKRELTREAFEVIMFDLNNLELQPTNDNQYRFKLIVGNLEDIFGMKQEDEE